MPARPKKKSPAKKTVPHKKAPVASVSIAAPSGINLSEYLEPTGPANGKTILVTDDDQALSHAISLKFRAAGFAVTVCHDGAEAIKEMDRKKYHGMILDLIMPEKTGFDVLQAKPNTLNKDTPVFVMSDMRTQETMDQVMGLGATNFFIKMQMPLRDVIAIISQAA